MATWASCWRASPIDHQAPYDFLLFFAQFCPLSVYFPFSLVFWCVFPSSYHPSADSLQHFFVPWSQKFLYLFKFFHSPVSLLELLLHHPDSRPPPPFFFLLLPSSSFPSQKFDFHTPNYFIFAGLFFPTQFLGGGASFQRLSILNIVFHSHFSFSAFLQRRVHLKRLSIAMFQC